MNRVLLLIAALVAAAPAAAADDIVVRESAVPVKRTLDRLTEIVTAKGFTVFARIDHAAAAAKVGRTLRPTEVLIFGSAKVGTPLMESAQGAALDLPIRVAAWEDAEGKVWLSYTAPATIAKRYGITDRDTLIGKMTAALDHLTAAAAKP